MMYKHVLGLFYLYTTSAFSVVNIALKKPSELSSMYEPPHYECCDSDYAVDGYIHDWVNGDFCCAHTDHVEDKQEWWSVDLQDVYTIDYTYIYGRTDCCVDHLANFDVEVISPGTCNRWNNFAIGNIFHCQYQSTGVQQITLTCPPNTSGRFVRIKRRDLLPLVICELEVYGNLSNSHLESGLESKTKTAYACGHIGYRYLGPVIYTSVAQSNIECTTMCITKTACTAAEYVKKTNVCLLKVSKRVIDSSFIKKLCESSATSNSQELFDQWHGTERRGFKVPDAYLRFQFELMKAIHKNMKEK